MRTGNPFYIINFIYPLTFLVLILIFSCHPEKEGLIVENNEPQAKPWTRWWWMGSSVTVEGITRHMEAFSEKGLGGVEIVPIYGEKGDEENFLDYMSPAWQDMLIHTLEEAERLNMQVDITLGSGWPYGGPWITEEYAAREYIPGDVTGKPTRQMVKRAAPGAEGLVADHFNRAAMDVFLAHFDSLLIELKQRGLPLRAVFNDSYEVYGANWTPAFGEEFRNRRGYDLLEKFPHLFDTIRETTEKEALSDYHETVNDLLFESTAENIREWCETHGLKYRYQAHGSPGNLLDLYGQAHIPETESFGSSHFDIPGVRFDTDFQEERFSRPDPLIMKFASSPAHLAGRELVSSETGTWLGNHFKVSFSQLKPEIDLLFTAGINHIFYHGIPYSPFDKPFPGRLFYASTNFGPASNLWDYLDEMNQYITRCQSILQQTTPDNDILLYFPVFDLWDEPGSENKILMQGVHNPDRWFYDTTFGQLASYLLNEGFTFDYVSDRQISHFAQKRGELKSSHKVLIVPAASHMPVTTLRNLIILEGKGLPVLFIDQFPAQVPGHYRKEERKDSLEFLIINSKDYFVPPVSRGRLKEEFAGYNVSSSPLGQDGLHFIRKSHPGGKVYFITNLGAEKFDQFFSVTGNPVSVELYAPLTGRRGLAETTSEEDKPGVRLQLDPGQSLFLITYHYRASGKEWIYFEQTGDPVTIDSGWEIHFSDTVRYPMDSLRTWTKLPFPWAPYYSGSATYKVHFRLDDKMLEKDYIRVDPGNVREMAVFRLNGKTVGKTWCVPYRLDVPVHHFKKENLLETEVTNLDINRIIRLDKNKADWKNFYDINFVDITYEPFNASEWEPMPSGLLGPVKLIPY